jgi:hypothetical protein
MGIGSGNTLIGAWDTNRKGTRPYSARHRTRPRRRGDRINQPMHVVLLRCMSQKLARMRPTGRADQCPQLGVERTQRGRRFWAVHDPNPDIGQNLMFQ